MVSKIIDIVSKVVLVGVLLFVFGGIMHSRGANSVAQTFCKVRGFQSGFTVPPGIVCRAHVPFPYDLQPITPSKKAPFPIK